MANTNNENSKVKLVKGDLDPHSSTVLNKNQKRILEINRLAQEAELAAKKAKDNGKNDLANKLEAKAKKLRDLLKGKEIPEIEESGINNSKNSKSKSTTESDEDEFDEYSDIDNDGKPRNNNSKNNNKTNGNTNKNDSASKNNNQTSNDENDSASKNNNQTSNDENNKSTVDIINNKQQQINDGSNKGSNNSNSNNNNSNNQKTNSPLSNTSNNKQNQQNNNKIDNKNEENENDENDDNSDNQNGDDQNDDQDNKNSKSKLGNPFKQPENQTGGSGNQNQPTKDELIKKIKQVLSTLKDPAEKERVKKDIDDIITSRNGTKVESLKEDLDKEIQDYSDDEFTKEMNDVVDLIAEADDIDVIDQSKVVGKIKTWRDDPQTIKELKQENNMNKQKDHRESEARENELARYNKCGTLYGFEIDFYNTIKDQVDMIKQDYQDYSEINTDYPDDDGIIMKADVVKEIQNEALPIVNLYFDMSNSWTVNKDAIEAGKRAVNTIKEFHDKGEIKLNVLYFSNANRDGFATSMTDSRLDKGTFSWKAIIKHIKATNANNVVLMTDTDMRDEAADYSPCIVDGYVWFIWDKNTACPEIREKLLGEKGSSQYELDY